MLDIVIHLARAIGVASDAVIVVSITAFIVGGIIGGIAVDVDFGCGLGTVEIVEDIVCGRELPSLSLPPLCLVVGQRPVG